MSSPKNNPSPRLIQVDIVSDIVCPWCWFGARYFLAASEQSPHTPVLTWRPYMLDPTVPRGGVPYKTYMKNKFGDGPSDRFRAMREQLELAGPDVGITFNFDTISMRPNTLNAHRLMRWAGGQNLANEMADNLFAAFFKDNLDVGDSDILAEIAESTGLDGRLVTDLLSTDRDESAVNEEIDFFRRLGVSGVPTFIYEGQFALQGAQPVDMHLEAMEKAAKLASETA